MTSANATSCDQMVKEIRLLVADQPRIERIEMLDAIERGCWALKWSADITPDPAELAHDRELEKADDRRDFEKGKQP